MRIRDCFGASGITLVGRAAATISSLYMFRIVMRNYSLPDAGLWVVVSSLSSVLAFGDFGLGTATMNLIAKYSAQGRNAAVRKTLSAGWMLLLGITIILLVIAVVLLFALDWKSIVRYKATDESPVAVVAALIVPTILAIPLNLASRAQLALGQAPQDAFYYSVSAVLTGISGAALMLSRCAIWTVILSSSCIPFLVRFAQSWRFARANRELLGSSWYKHFEMDFNSELARPAALFFALQVAATLAYSLDTYLANCLLGPVDVIAYAAANRLFLVVQVSFGILLGPLWPYFTRMYASGAFARAWQHAMYICAATVALAVGFDAIAISLRAFIFQRWLGAGVMPSRELLIWFGVWAVINALGSVVTMMLSALDCVSIQIICALSMAAASFGLKLWLCPRIGGVALPIATIVAYVPLSLLPCIIALGTKIGRCHTRATSASIPKDLAVTLSDE